MMTTRATITAAALALGLGLAALSAASAAPQQTTSYPGQMTDARVWVQNRSKNDAVAVDLSEISLKRPITVHVANGEAGDTLVVESRAARQLWDYETVTAPRENLAATLTTHGGAGWEAIGVLAATPDGTTILLKRPR